MLKLLGGRVAQWARSLTSLLLVATLLLVPQTWAALIPSTTAEPPQLSNDVFERLLLQTEISTRVPINLIQVPGIQLSNYLFAKEQYSVLRFDELPEWTVKLGLKRLYLDLYFDSSRNVWQVCPKPYPQKLNASQTTSDSDTQIFSSICPKPTVSLESLFKSLVAWLTEADASGEFDKSLDAVYLVLNLHDLPVVSNKTLGAPQSLSSIIGSAFSTRLYTPRQLAIDRANLNASWLVTPTDDQTLLYSIGYTEFLPYYDLVLSKSTPPTVSTSTGWPRLGNLLTTRKRVLAGIGSVENSLRSKYNITSDNNTIFMEQTLQPQIFPLETADLDNCLPAPNTYLSSSGGTRPLASIPEGANVISPSFIYIQESSSFPWTTQLLAKAAWCGFSPLFVNSFNQSWMDSLVWTWASNEPSNAGRCAAISTAISGGRWFAKNCDDQLPIACQSVNDPHNWTITVDRPLPYYAVGDIPFIACPKGYVFSVPRTPASQRFLLRKMMEMKVDTIWLNFNSILQSGCWVTGTDACPYDDRTWTISRILELSYREGIGILLVATAGASYKLRRQMKAHKARMRKAEVRRKTRALEAISLPA